MGWNQGQVWLDGLGCQLVEWVLRTPQAAKHGITLYSDSMRPLVLYTVCCVWV